MSRYKMPPWLLTNLGMIAELLAYEQGGASYACHEEGGFEALCNPHKDQIVPTLSEMVTVFDPTLVVRQAHAKLYRCPLPADPYLYVALCQSDTTVAQGTLVERRQDAKGLYLLSAPDRPGYAMLLSQLRY